MNLVGVWSAHLMGCCLRQVGILQRGVEQLQLVSLTPLYTISREAQEDLDELNWTELNFSCSLCCRFQYQFQFHFTHTPLSAEACSSVLKMESNVLLVLQQNPSHTLPSPDETLLLTSRTLLLPLCAVLFFFLLACILYTFGGQLHCIRLLAARFTKNHLT